MLFKNFTPNLIRFQTPAGDTFAIAAGKEKDCPDRLVKFAIESGLAPVEQVSAKVYDDSELVAAEKAAKEAEEKAKVEAAEAEAAALEAAAAKSAVKATRAKSKAV